MEDKVVHSTFYIGPTSELGDPRSNEIIVNALRDTGRSTDLVFKKYKKGNIRIWGPVPAGFVQDLYKQYSPTLKFLVYCEHNYTLELFRLFEPGIRKKAKAERYKKKRRK